MVLNLTDLAISYLSPVHSGAGREQAFSHPTLYVRSIYCRPALMDGSFSPPVSIALLSCSGCFKGKQFSGLSLKSSTPSIIFPWFVVKECAKPF